MKRACDFTVTEQRTIATTMLSLVNCFLLTCLLKIIFRPGMSYTQVENTTRPEVMIPQGILQGITLTTRRNRNISAFLGIPYGQPPIGDLRFANPMGADGWEGTRDASFNANVCPQISGEEVVGEEDCLYLNVYTPQLPENTNSSLLPVMVYIHGGAFTTGSASSTRFGPDYLLDEDVVFLAPNYRIGPLGFLSTGDVVASGNWGLKDQVLALKWVQNNIKYFGGDPAQVTLFGQSAGSTSVHLLTLSNSTIGLFHRYITQSGSALGKWAHQPRATYAKRAFELGEYVGCSNDTSDSLINCLRAANFSDIMATFSEFRVWKSVPEIVWFPTDEPDIEGAILTDSPTNLFAAKKIRDLPWITGVVRDEGLMFTVAFYEDEDMFEEFLEKIDIILPEMLSLTYQPDSGAAWVKAMKSYYFNNDLTGDRSVLLSNLTLLINDAIFLYPAYNALRQQFALAKNPEYFYTFNYRGTYSGSYFHGGSTTNYGVTHGDDNLYLFSPELRFSDYEGTLSETDFEMVDIMVQLWTSFAINGTPTTLAFDGNTTWEPYSAADNYIRIGNESDVALEVQYSFVKARMQFWTDLEMVWDDSAAPTNSYSSLVLVLLPACLNFIMTAVLE